MPLRPDGKTSPGSDGRSELRSDILPMPPTNRASMPIFHVDNTAAFPRRDQLEVPGSRAREDTTGRGTSADGSGEVHTPKEDPAGNQWIGRPRDVQDLSQDPQAGAQDHLQGQGQIRNNINGICRGDGRVPQVPGLAPGERKVRAEDLRPLTERQSVQIRSALEKSVCFWKQIQETLF